MFFYNSKCFGQYCKRQWFVLVLEVFEEFGVQVDFDEGQFEFFGCGIVELQIMLEVYFCGDEVYD